MADACAACGQTKVLKYKSYQFFFFENTDMSIGEIPENSTIEIHPTFILFEGTEGWRTLIPMSCIRFMNVSEPVT